MTGFLKKLVQMDYLFDSNSEGGLIVTRFRIGCAILVVGLITAISVIFATTIIQVPSALKDHVAVIALIWPAALALSITALIPVPAKAA